MDGWCLALSIPSLPRATRHGKVVGPQAWLVDDYFVTGRRETDWMGSRVVKFHRTVEDYVSLIQSAGLQLETLREPAPAPDRFASQQEFRRRQRIPLFLLLSAIRQGSG